jgi:hypothetical protein
MSKYLGSCHCGRIKFEVQSDGGIDSATACNCSICQRKGSLLWFVPREALTLLTPEADVATYTFNKHHIKHRFCTNCGMHPWGEATAPNGKPMAAINIRCLEDVDLKAVPVKEFNGRAL